MTLATHDMPGAVRFYRALGFTVRHGGENAPFTSGRGSRPSSRPWMPTGDGHEISFARPLA